MNGKDLVFLDNAASTQKPKQVLDKMNYFYENNYANIHRGTYKIAENATQEYENTRKKVQKFINASNPNEIVFTKGTTDAINLLAYSLGNDIKSGDEIVITAMEHHANIVPWQILCQQKGAVLKVIPINLDGELILDNISEFITDKTKILSLVHISNTLGTVNPIKKLIDYAHNFDAYVIIDGAQSIQHKKIDVEELDCDFYVFSAHKLYAPTGVGVLYGKKEILDKIPPYQTGGEMIAKVTFEKTTFNSLPYKFEAGTPNIAGVIGLGAAIDYINEIGIEHIDNYENELLKYATGKICKIDRIKIIGNANNKASVISFLFDGIHPTDIGTMADAYGIAMRVGHHCTQPLMDYFGIPGTCRASFAFYNTKKEIDFLEDSLLRIKKLLG
jgi:cysteine desulfurase/selenocysteine lyase